MTEEVPRTTQPVVGCGGGVSVARAREAAKWLACKEDLVQASDSEHVMGRLSWSMIRCTATKVPLASRPGNPT